MADARRELGCSAARGSPHPCIRLLPRRPPPRPAPPFFPQVPVDEVEAWVVSTISEGLIDARMDQLTSSIVVTRAMQREFGQVQWTQLQAKLAAWTASVSQLLTSIEQRGGGDHTATGGR